MNIYGVLLVVLFFNISSSWGGEGESSVGEYRLPQLTIDDYKRELLELQKLQRNNEKLQLMEKNLALKEKMQSLGGGGIETTRVVNIFSSIKVPGGFMAEIYNTYDGMKTVELGSYVMKIFKVVQITPTYVRLKKIDVPSDDEQNYIDLKLIAFGGE